MDVNHQHKLNFCKVTHRLIYVLNQTVNIGLIGIRITTRAFVWFDEL